MSKFHRIIFFLGVFLTFGNKSYSQVNAAFSADQTFGCGTFLVHFTNLSTGSGTLSYSWDFGNGNVSTSANPSALYSVPGTYTVVLNVSNGINADQEVQVNYITVYTLPQPNFSATPTAGCPPLNVAFSNSSINGSAPVDSVIWDFGDGNISFGLNSNHVYTQPGNYTVSMLVRDENGCTSNQSFPASIQVNNNAPVADFLASDSVLCNSPFSVQFTNQTIGTGSTSYLWDFGDGSTSSQANPNHTYLTSGNYSVSLTATYTTGCGDTETKTNYITAVGNLNSNFIADDTTVCAGVPIHFSNLTVPVPNSVVWDFGDGTTSNQPNPIHSYSNPGNYTVTLTNRYDATCFDQVVKLSYVFVSESPIADFTADVTHSCSPPLTVNFTNQSTGTGPLSFQWNFGNGVSNVQDPTRLYGTSGVFDVQLVVTNPIGCRDTLMLDNYIITRGPVANLSVSSYYPCVPVAVGFSDQSSGPFPITTWNWNFGDGSNSTIQNPGHTYGLPGSYQISLDVTDSQGCTDVYTYPTLISSYTKPIADFATADNSICAGTSSQFSDLSTGANQWTWSLDGIVISNSQNPLLSLDDTGYVSVGLIAGNNGCYDTLTRDSFLYLLAPVNRFTYSKDCTAPLTVFYNDTSILPDTYFWDFGDGSTSTQADPNHTYSSTGQYTVIHTVTNVGTGCSDTDTLSLTLTNTSSTFVAVTPRTGCAPLSVTFDIIGSGIIGRTWSFGDGTTGSGSDPVHVYSQPGVYDVSLILRYNSGCADTLIEPGYVVVNGPQATFTVDTLFSCDSVIANFSGSSPSNITNWDWDFGDGNTGVGQSVSHSYLSTGNFPVELTVTEVSGCTSSVILPSAVSILPLPFPNFEVDDNTPCPGQDVDFHRLFSAVGLSVFWDFGDGTSSNQPNITHSYSNPGNYTVSVTVTNANGCSQTNISSNLIQIAIPTANFSAAPTVANCPPLLASFTDQSSSDVVSWFWDFGDGTNSIIENPGHLYNVSGEFQVSLVVTNSNGCKDSLLIDSLIAVRGPYGSFSFSPDTLGCPPYLITFNATAFNTTDYTWDFGDGDIGYGPTITHLFQNLGSYLPNLLLENANTGCSFTIGASDSISISPLPVYAGLDQTICLGESVQLQASGGTSYLWGPSTGLNIDTLSNPVASPNQTTDYIVTIVKGLCSNSDTVRVVVRPNPFAGFVTDSVCEGNLTNFTNLSTNDTLSSTFVWDFGGNTSNALNPTYLFPGFGVYPVQLVVSSSNGCVDTIRQNVVVHAVPSWDASAQDVCLNEDIDFSGILSIGQGNVSSIVWDFGDGTSQMSLHPIHTYLQSDTFQVSSIATSDQGCTDTSRLEVVVYPLPLAFFETESVCLREASIFVDSSTISSGIINQWNWNFGDGTSSAQMNPSHIYLSAGTFPVSLVVSSFNGCKDTFNLSQVINPLPQVQFFATTDSSCFSPVQINFINQTTGASQYIWTYGNTDSSIGFDGQVTYDSAGLYSVQLVAVTNLGCRDSISSDYPVYPTPVADFSVVDPIGCEPFYVDFNNNSLNGVTYSWGFGDGQNSSEQEPFHVFQTAGAYSVSLTITGQGGCQNSIYMPGMIQVLPRPFADFDYTIQTDPQIDGTVFFTNQSVDNVSSSWNLGDGVFSNENDSLVHQYEFWGNKDVLLMITAANGCTDTVEKTIRIGFFGGLFVPNALVLGADGEFGMFLPKGKGLKEYRLTIWDEWGNLIFETQKLENSMPAEGWNGYFKGEPVPLDSYFWKIEARFENGEYWIGKEVEPRLYKDAGTVTVIR